MSHDDIDKLWRLYDHGRMFATLAENGDDCPTLTFVPDECGGDGKPISISERALRTLRDALDDMLGQTQPDGGAHCG